jgi:hypothetical protein
VLQPQDERAGASKVEKSGRRRGLHEGRVGTQRNADGGKCDDGGFLEDLGRRNGVRILMNWGDGCEIAGRKWGGEGRRRQGHQHDRADPGNGRVHDRVVIKISANRRQRRFDRDVEEFLRKLPTFGVSPSLRKATRVWEPPERETFLSDCDSAEGETKSRASPRVVARRAEARRDVKNLVTSLFQLSRSTNNLVACCILGPAV